MIMKIKQSQIKQFVIKSLKKYVFRTHIIIIIILSYIIDNNVLNDQKFIVTPRRTNDFHLFLKCVKY